MRKKQIRALLALMLAFVFVLCAGCGNGSSGSGGTKVTLNEVAHSIFYAPMYVAIEEGYFEEEGIDLTLVTGFGVIILIQTFYIRQKLRKDFPEFRILYFIMLLATLHICYKPI